MLNKNNSVLTVVKGRQHENLLTLQKRTLA